MRKLLFLLIPTLIISCVGRSTSTDTQATTPQITSTTLEDSLLYGSWVEPIPSMEGVQGLTLSPGGTASSVNMATLVYQSWSMGADSSIILIGESIGNGQTIMFCDTMKVAYLSADSLVLSKGASITQYRKQ